MRDQLTFWMLPLLAVGLACSSAEVVSPGLVRESVASRAAVPGASAYTATAYAVDGWFADVNDQNLIVGMGNGRAIALPWGGTLQYMSSGPAIIAKALAVNTHGVIVGSVSSNCCAWSGLVPAIWSDYTAHPKLLPDEGEAVDINDQELAVGYLMLRGVSRAFVWNVRTGSVSLLPQLLRGGSSAARAINNDQVILGWSDSRSGTLNVLWQRNGTGWSVRLLSGINGMDLDAGYGVVGETANRASFGKPDYVSDFNVLGYSYAEAVSPSGVLATGTDAGAATGWPVSSVAFVADRNGTTTYLPWPVNGTWRDGFGMGVTNCGLVVGTGYPLTSNWQPYTAQPIVWDPGC